MWNNRIKNFTEYFSSPLADVFKRFYMIVDTKYSTFKENPIGAMIGKTRESLFDQIEIDSSNYKSLPIMKGFPVLNFSKKFDVVRNMLQDKVIDERDLYNMPESSKMVSDKVSFHRAFSAFDFVPKTVFTVEETAALKFPIVAKPSYGKSAEGIKKFSTFEELKSSSDSFDLFSEAIDIAKEYRCFCFKDKVLEIDERIKVPGSADFLKNAEEKTQFIYSPSDYFSDELRAILKVCNGMVNLDFFSLDFAVDSEGKVKLIEMNSRTGMGVPKMLKLYSAIHRDFYGEDLPESTEETFEKLTAEWEALYNEEKRPDINECTTVVGKIGDGLFLFKNRDRSFTPNNKVIHETIGKTEVAYYSDQTEWVEGMNEHGIGFVFSMFTGKQLRAYKPTYFMKDEPSSKITDKFRAAHDKMKKVLQCSSLDKATKIIEDAKMSGSFLVADSKTAFEIEIFQGTVKKKEVKFEEGFPFLVKTNHGILIPRAGHQPSGKSIKRAGSVVRKHQAEQYLMGVDDIEQVPLKMKMQQFDFASPMNVFRTDAEENTISQCLMNLKKLKFMFYSDNLTSNDVILDDKLKGKGKIKIEVFDLRKQ